MSELTHIAATGFDVDQDEFHEGMVVGSLCRVQFPLRKDVYTNPDVIICQKCVKLAADLTTGMSMRLHNMYESMVMMEQLLRTAKEMDLHIDSHLPQYNCCEHCSEPCYGGNDAHTAPCNEPHCYKGKTSKKMDEPNHEDGQSTFPPF